MRPRQLRPRGFTLIEIVVTLAIIVLLLSISVASLGSFWHSRDLELPAAKLKEFAKRARNLAILEQRPFQVEITPHGLALFSIVADATQGNPLAGDGGRQRGLVDRYDWEEEVVMTVRRWNRAEFLEPSRQVWVFERSGLCEPLTARIESEFGFIEMTFNALDAHVEDKVAEIR
ncbi:MAG: pilus assembly FimT family protein [Verrucomicrobiales bacterium]